MIFMWILWRSLFSNDFVTTVFHVAFGDSDTLSHVAFEDGYNLRLLLVIIIFFYNGTINGWCVLTLQGIHGRSSPQQTFIAMCLCYCLEFLIIFEDRLIQCSIIRENQKWLWNYPKKIPILVPIDTRYRSVHVIFRVA